MVINKGSQINNYFTDIALQNIMEANMPYCTLITWSGCHLYLGKYELRREKNQTRLDTNRPPQHRQSVLYKIIY